jgi:16S rRNA (cytosine967-C5)-methyltransferase
VNGKNRAFGFQKRRENAEVDAPPPPGLAVRQAAAAALAEIIVNGRTLDERLASDEAAGRLSRFDVRDRALMRSIVIVALRRYGTIKAILAELLERGLPKKAQSLEWILAVAAAQILFMDVPDHAAVDLAVHATKRENSTQPFASLVNGVLRNMTRGKDALLAKTDPSADIPSWLLARWRKTYGDETAAKITAILREEPTLDLSVRSDAAQWAERLGGIVLPTGSVRLSTHKPVSELEGYADGQWWVQDVSAALPARLLATAPGERVADLCAAPGGKTIQLALSGAKVTALDRSAERMKRVAANLQRMGAEADLQVGDANSFDAGPFDAILLDAPCTATGTIRRNPDVAWTKRASHIQSMVAAQAKMLDRSISLLKPGGRLVYCTCSLEPEEGELQVAALLRRNPDVVRLPISAEEIGGLAGCLTPEGEVRTLPHDLPGPEPRLSGMDGFFMARLGRKKPS